MNDLQKLHSRICEHRRHVIMQNKFTGMYWTVIVNQEYKKLSDLKNGIDIELGVNEIVPLQLLIPYENANIKS